MSSAFEAIVWQDGKIILLDQTKIPISETYNSYDEVTEFIGAIQNLVVRGAPALGVAGAYGVVLAIDEASRKGLSAKELEQNIDSLRDARPTAVNLAWAVEQIRTHLPAGRDAVLAAAHQLAREDKESSTSMGNIGADWLISKLGSKPLTLLTHCNTGSLATTGTGTALGVIKELHKRGNVKEVYADETRPLLQGSRLTAWELMKSDIPYRIEPDGAAAMAILSGRIDAALIGADRIARNGDSANKIGSLSVALACHAAGIPFLVVAPESTVDRSIADGSEIHIEIRGDEELTHFKGQQVAPTGAKTFNPAFDVTPAKYISAVITELMAYEIAKGETL
jgi:methylthioribose-1-phosphate isomerase